MNPAAEYTPAGELMVSGTEGGGTWRLQNPLPPGRQGLE